MVMPQPFTTTAPVNANYDWSDVANGIGYETYYLIESQDSTGKDYHLITNNDYSNRTAYGGVSFNMDLDFDSSVLTIPRTIDGDVLISLATYELSGGSVTTWTVELYKYDGSTETQLGSTITFASAPANAKMFYFRMAVDNEIIKVGESIRLRVALNNPSSTPRYLGIDPANRSDGNLTITTTSKIHIPFKLDL